MWSTTSSCFGYTREEKLAVRRRGGRKRAIGTRKMAATSSGFAAIWLEALRFRSKAKGPPEGGPFAFELVAGRICS
jgi:hypothetical protein